MWFGTEDCTVVQTDDDEHPAPSIAHWTMLSTRPRRLHEDACTAKHPAPSIAPVPDDPEHPAPDDNEHASPRREQFQTIASTQREQQAVPCVTLSYAASLTAGTSPRAMLHPLLPVTTRAPAWALVAVAVAEASQRQWPWPVPKKVTYAIAMAVADAVAVGRGRCLPKAVAFAAIARECH